MNQYQITGSILLLQGPLTKGSVPALHSKLVHPYKLQPVKLIDLTEVSQLDTAGVALIDLLINTCPAKPELKFANQGQQSVYQYFSGQNLDTPKTSVKPGLFERLGQTVINTYTTLNQAMYLTADTMWWSVVGLVNRRGQRKGSTIVQGVLIGVDSLPIVALLSFIIGIILALQAAVQLRQFGADVFLADLMSLSMVREMAPMMTAVIVAGRSGSAIAAEIATMKVTEEIDALKMMAINPIRYVVVPKFHAITITMPLLVTFSIIVGLVGGFLVATGYLGLSGSTYFAGVIKVLEFKDLALTMAKSVVFSWIIVIIGAYYGLGVSGGAEGVGRATTASVVASIFTVIVFDALFSFLYL